MYLFEARPNLLPSYFAYLNDDSKKRSFKIADITDFSNQLITTYAKNEGITNMQQLAPYISVNDDLVHQDRQHITKRDLQRALDKTTVQARAAAPNTKAAPGATKVKGGKGKKRCL